MIAFIFGFLAGLAASTGNVGSAVAFGLFAIIGQCAVTGWRPWHR